MILRTAYVPTLCELRSSSKAAIPRFGIRIRMRISIRIRTISMRTPYFTFQYPSNVYACFNFTLNRAFIIHMKI